MDGLVGKKYPGSTGGEIFNYYGTDSNKNIASGDYSTAKGRKNQALGQYSFVAGYNNKIKGQASVGLGYGNDSGNTNVKANSTLLMGYGNSVQNTSTYCSGNVLLGSNNSMPSGGGDAQYNVLMGRDNSIGDRHVGSVLCGNGLSTSSSMALNVCVYGVENKTTTSLADPIVVIGCGQNYVKKTAIEISNTQCKIRNKLQLEYDDTEVNAITPPQDPNNVTTDDQTLVTKSHLTNALGNYAKSQVAYLADWDTASALPLDNTTVVLPTAYGAIPSWAKRAILTFRWENELITKEIFFDKSEGIHLHVVQRAYSTFPDTIHYRHLRIEWDFTNQTLLVADYWTYDQDMANAGAVSNWDYTLTNASDCKILSVVYSE